MEDVKDKEDNRWRMKRGFDLGLTDRQMDRHL